MERDGRWREERRKEGRKALAWTKLTPTHPYFFRCPIPILHSYGSIYPNHISLCGLCFSYSERPQRQVKRVNKQKTTMTRLDHSRISSDIRWQLALLYLLVCSSKKKEEEEEINWGGCGESGRVGGMGQTGGWSIVPWIFFLFAWIWQERQVKETEDEGQPSIESKKGEGGSLLLLVYV